MRQLILHVVVGILLLVMASNSKAAQLVGGTGVYGAGFPFSVVSVNPMTSELAPLSPAISNHFFTGLDVAPDRTLYGVSQNLFRIDLVSGTVTDIGPLRLNGGPPILMAAMAISPAGKIFTVDNANSALYTVNINTAALTRIGGINLVRGIAFTPDGSLYGGFANLYKIDSTNAHILADLGKYGGTQTFIGDLDYYNGSLRGVYTYEEAPNTPKSILYSIDMAGAPGQLATKLNEFDASLFSIATVPEPSSQMLAAFAVICLAARRFRRQ